MRRFLAILALGALTVPASGCGALAVTPPDGVADIHQLLTPDATGWVDKSATGATGIQGQWRVFDEGRFAVRGVTAESCQTAKYGECSIVREPAPRWPYAPTPGLGMCTSGVIARWIAGSDGLTPDGSPGRAGIVLDLNTPDWPEPRTGMNAPAGQPYDADAHGVTGFAFDIDSEPAPDARLRVEIATVGPKRPPPDSKPAYWGATYSDGSPVHAGRNEFWWSDLPKPFYPKAMLRIAFTVSGNDKHALSYDFCINHLTAIRSPSGASGGDPSMKPYPGLVDQLLLPDPNGWVDKSTTGKTEIQGSWFATADGLGPTPTSPGGCQIMGHTDCSIVNEPYPFGNYPPTKDLGMCTSGVVAKGNGSDGIWGAMIDFMLNVDLDGARPYDALIHEVTGFAFDIDSEPAPGAEIRVLLKTERSGANAPWWDGDTRAWSPVHAGHNEFRWEEVGGPSYNNDPPPFDPKTLTDIAFLVAANPTYAVSYGFCIKNLTALRH